ncbi:MAG: DNA methyltransferase [Rhizomicrobium sp.]
MKRLPKRMYLDLSVDAEIALISGARSAAPVKGLTHGYYKYPARFSPEFVRAAIEAFTDVGDVCLDPHVGGGTTLVEALALGRNAIGVDISTLAEFVTSTKTTVFSPLEILRLKAWTARVKAAVDIRKSSSRSAAYEELGYYKHLDHPSRWRLSKAIDQALASADRLSAASLVAFARCAVLRTAQWALDGRKHLPTIEEFRTVLSATATEMIIGAEALIVAVTVSGVAQPKITVLNRSAAGMEDDDRLKGWSQPKLVLTSPPYPGVHVLYHRWQVDGRKEAPLPFMIANKLDGAGSSFYTMGDRKYPELKTYFDNVRSTFASTAALAGEDTVIVQMLAFSQPEWQLDRYLATMEEAGLTEVFLKSLSCCDDGRLWRQVPGRRWYSDQRGVTPGSQEVVLFHRRRQGQARPMTYDRMQQSEPLVEQRAN